MAGVGASAPSSNQMADERVQPGQRGYEKEEGKLAGTRGNKGAVPRRGCRRVLDSDVKGVVALVCILMM